MRLTTTTATLAVAGLAALASGCSSSGQSATGPVVVHHAAPAAAAKPAAPRLTPRQVLAQATRASLAAHTAVYTELETIVYAKQPTRGLNTSPILNLSGVADFDNNTATQNAAVSNNAQQPQFPLATVLIDGSNVYQALTDVVVTSGKWVKSSATACDNVDQITDVLSQAKGPISVYPHGHVGSETGINRYTVKWDFGAAMAGGSCGGPATTAAPGQLVTEDVWVDHEGLIRKERYTIDPGQVHMPGVDPAKVKAVVLTIELDSYGVRLVVPPHPTA